MFPKLDKIKLGLGRSQTVLSTAISVLGAITTLVNTAEALNGARPNVRLRVAHEAELARVATATVAAQQRHQAIMSTAIAQMDALDSMPPHPDESVMSAG